MEPFEELSLLQRLKFQEYELTERQYLQAELNALGSFAWTKFLQQYIDYNLSLINEGERVEERFMYYWNFTIIREQSNVLETSVRDTIRAEELKEKLINIQEELQLNLKNS